MVVLHVKYTGRYTYVYKPVARLYQPAYLQPCDHLVTTKHRLAGMTIPGFGQPSDQVVTTLPPPCSQVVTRLLQAGCTTL